MTLKTLLLGAGAIVAMAPAAFAERGDSGHVNLIYYQAPSIMNPYLSSGTKDLEASSLVLEPLIRFNPQGEMLPWLITEIPTVENGGISEDLKTITYKLKPGLKWSDGSDFTADDVVFTGQYCMDPEGGCAQLARFEGIDKIEAVDPQTVKITFKEPKPYPYLAFASYESPILQKKQFENCTGTAAPTCSQQNFNPIGTGAFKVDDFRPNDVISLSANPEYRDPALPHFATMTLKGGGDAAAAARSVLETGEYDYAWNTQLAPEVLDKMLQAGKGEAIQAFGSLVERIEMNMTDPSPDLPDGERATAKHPHPILSDIKVRQALSMAIDRQLLSDIGYGAAGKPTCNLVPAPEAYADETNTGCLTQDIEGAKKLLDEDGWKVGADGIREKDGRKLHLLFQTSTNAVRQDYQSIIKQWWQEIGVDTELKNVDGSVYFGGDPGSPDTFQKFYADVEMYANNFAGTDPEQYLAMYTCNKAPRPETGWQGENINRYCNADYDKLVAELGRTADLDKRHALAKQMNDMLTKDSMTIVPLVYRGTASAKSKTLGGVEINAWDSQLWNVADWYRIK
ncbi:peptide ABC transporter substrate-binding protein [Pseudooceanicola sp. GBMRC 2024]|uniref:Peptide ABC transporter substrate-binding protein n=1 Tax=Pseudooceanicola albus TaxID=2692189 RepID=A0A6L7G396_9RHOB|nr:peptide ABC transporter substrate-binding protein [Pseudooceanicola albus]MXN17860.1 peptide ABC transporter substrate-binding protein [Pseudooceanicola albus]